VPGECFVIAERYRLDSEIASGVTGRVFRATDLTLSRQVAVKVLRPEYARAASALERFRAAARLAGAVSHASVAEAYDFGEATQDSSPYLVTELVQGPSLAEVIAVELVMAPFLAGILRQVADGLSAAHACGLAHGNLKPSNVLLGKGARADRVVKVTDFGIADAVAASPVTGRAPGTAHGPGAAAYLAPERAGGGAGTPASDLYSLGIMAFEWLTGTPPFTGTRRQVLAAHLRQPLPPLPPAVPEGLAGLVTRLTVKDPARRLASASEAAAIARTVARSLARQRNDTLFPLLGFDPAGSAETLEQPAVSGPLARDEPGPGSAGDGLPGPRGGLAGRKREIIWAASAVVFAGLVGWAAAGPVQDAVRIVHEAIAQRPATATPSPSPSAPAPGQGGVIPAVPAPRPGPGTTPGAASLPPQRPGH
jgi:serine/threonine-protein kinase